MQWLMRAVTVLVSLVYVSWLFIVLWFASTNLGPSIFTLPILLRPPAAMVLIALTGIVGYGVPPVLGFCFMSLTDRWTHH